MAHSFANKELYCSVTTPPLHAMYETRLSRQATEDTYQSRDFDASTRRWSNRRSPLPHKTVKRSKHIYSDRFIPSRVTTTLNMGFDVNPDPTDDEIYQVYSPRYEGGPASSRGDNQRDARVQPSVPVASGPTNQGASPSVSEFASSSGPSSGLHAPDNTAKDVHGVSHSSTASYSMLLKSELLGIKTPMQASPSEYFQYMDSYSDPFSPPTARAMMSGASAFNFPSVVAGSAHMTRHRGTLQDSPNMMRFRSMPSSSLHGQCQLAAASAILPYPGLGFGATGVPRLHGSGQASTTRRKFPKTPFKMLDAPALQDDFYLNLVDWSSTNVLAVGLGACVYLWSACTGNVTKLCDLGGSDTVTSVAWSPRGSHLSVGTTSGAVQLWEAASGKKVRTMSGHVARVGTLAWSSQLIASGSRDRSILLRDIRAPAAVQHKLVGHKQEVCGLKWSFDGQQLASGGNDNKLLVWSLRASTTSSSSSSVSSSSSSSSSSGSIPVVRFSDHTAAVKAIAWSPHQHGLLASGGGTADRCIRFWNTQTATALSAVDTGSQVCNLMWAKHVNEIVSTHGYSLNQIIVWKYPTMAKLATLTGHTFRVLYLAMSPDGQTIVTGAGDETLRFWNAFPSATAKHRGRLGASALLPLGMGSEIR